MDALIEMLLVFGLIASPNDIALSELTQKQIQRLEQAVYVLQTLEEKNPNYEKQKQKFIVIWDEIEG